MITPRPLDAEESRSRGGDLGLNSAGTLHSFTLFLHTSLNKRNNLLRFSSRILLQICLYSTLLCRWGWKCASSLQTFPAVHPNSVHCDPGPPSTAKMKYLHYQPTWSKYDSHTVLKGMAFRSAGPSSGKGSGGLGLNSTVCMSRFLYYN